MKTAEDMYEYCVKNNFDQDWEKETALKHLKVIEQNLQEDEDVLMCFVGKREIMNGKCAFAITNKHISWGQQLLFSKWHKEILFNAISDIRCSTGPLNTMITFGAIGDDIGPKFVNGDITSVNQIGVTCSVKNITGQEIYNICKSTFEEAKRKLSQPTVNTPIPTSTADEILKYKNLLDMGAITQEEFETKKKQLLGL